MMALVGEWGCVVCKILAVGCPLEESHRDTCRPYSQPGNPFLGRWDRVTRETSLGREIYLMKKTMFLARNKEQRIVISHRTISAGYLGLRIGHRATRPHRT